MSLTRRQLLVRAGAAALVLEAGGSWPESQALAAVRRPFIAYGDGSYLTTPLRHYHVDPARTKKFRHFMRWHPDQRGHPYPMIRGVGGNRWGTAYAMGTHTDPIWRLTGDMNRECAILRTQGFHAPRWLGSMLTGTSDSPFCVIDRSFGYTVFGGKAKATGHRTINVTSAGISHHSSNGLTARNVKSDDPRNFTSRGRISEAMVIRKDLVDYGISHGTGLGHVLQMFLVETRTADGFRHPMVKCEGHMHGFGAEGERIALRRDVDLRRRDLSPAGLVIARTLRDYGCYFGDNAGSASSLKAEQENRHRRVWHEELKHDSLRGLSWDDFVVVAHPRPQ
jgi:hypothetical protein